ncbi:MAG: discoidin domain-containing protein [Planctomycetes bacterium]|nr:discoidin domain-containing protein [Planctomycetota bacterium]
MIVYPLLVVLAGCVAAAAEGGADDLKAFLERDWLKQAEAELAPPGGGEAAPAGVKTSDDAAGAVDGIKDGGFAFHTEREDRPWWQVDLGAVVPLARTVIWNRTSVDANRAAHLEVHLSGDGKDWRRVYAHDGSIFNGTSDGKPLVVPLEGQTARFVRIRLAETNWLHLDEVEVFGAADPEKNIALGRPADQSSVSQWSRRRGPAPTAALPQLAAYPIDEAIARARRLVDERRRQGMDVREAAGALEALAARAARIPQSDADGRRQIYLEARRIARPLVLSDPLLAFDELIIVERRTYPSSHIYTDHFDGSHLLGSRLCVLSPVAPHARVREIVPSMRDGIFGRFDLSFDGRRIVFAWKKDPATGYRIFEVGIDGSGLRQLTHDADDEAEMIARFRHGYDDMDPCYLPDGRIVFASTRAKRAVLCHNAFTSTALHIMDPDGGDMRCLSANTVNEFTPAIGDDGRILYTRWEYVDKGCGDVQSLWSMRPDGSQSAHVYKNNVRRPATLIDARSIPGSHRIIAVGAPHMPLSVGPVILIDTQITQRTPAAMTNLTPELGYPGHANYPGGVRFGYYKEPWPLSEDLYLVAYSPEANPHAQAGYAIYALDREGNRELIYRDPEISCFQPIPRRARIRPTAVADQSGEPASQGEGDGTLLLLDVYAGMDGIDRGRVKYIRVMEDVPKPWDLSYVSPGHGDSLGLQNPAVSLDGHFTTKKVWGIAEVEADGSAYFTVPADRNLYFQALDEDFLELQRMRTFVNLMPGERRSCIGCHELRTLVPSNRRAIALSRSPRALAPQPGDDGPRFVHYPTDVQPILDRHCARCHNEAKADGGLDLSGALTTLFNRSYESLIRKNLVDKIDVNPRDAFIPAEPPLRFGSHRSKVVSLLRDGHYEAKLTREEFIRVVTWIDANAPFYGTYGGKRNVKWRDDPEFRPAPPSSERTAARGAPAHRG